MPEVIIEILIWTGGVALIALSIAFVVGSLAALLFMLRFLRPRHLRQLLAGKLPEITQVGGGIKFLGQQVEANARLDSQRDTQITALEARITHLEEIVQRQAEALHQLLPRDQTE